MFIICLSVNLLLYTLIKKNTKGNLYKVYTSYLVKMLNRIFFFSRNLNTLSVVRRKRGEDGRVGGDQQSKLELIGKNASLQVK